MFISGGQVVMADDGWQFTKPGIFLILMRPKGSSHDAPLKAIVTDICLENMGHHMMGMLKVDGCEMTIDGDFGNKGLEMIVPPSIFQKFGIGLPPRIRGLVGMGHNSAGGARGRIKRWALKNSNKMTVLNENPAHRRFQDLISEA
jgi:hypothetical protein